MKLYCCYDTNEITENQYCDVASGFCIVEKYEYAYQRELPRFQNIDPPVIGFPFYGIPFEDIPRSLYLGIGNKSVSEDNCYFCQEDFPETEEEANEIRRLFFESDRCDIVWFKICGSDSTVPSGYNFCGCDITYVPDLDGAFSIINDCMFICKWHGCDENGTEFSSFFESLNEKGLFRDADTALAYMKHYLSFDWTERGEYCVCEIYRKN